MTTKSDREAILTEYGQWVEQKTLMGLDLSVKAYLDEVETEEYAEGAKAIEAILLDEGSNDPATFLTRARRILGAYPKEAANELDRS